MRDLLLRLWLVVALLGGGGAAHAAVAGGGEGLEGWLWWVRPEVGSEVSWLSVGSLDFSRSGEAVDAETAWASGSGVLVPRVRVRGRLQRDLLAASGDGRSAWAVMQHGSVVSWRLREAGLTGPAVEAMDGPRLPLGGTAMGLAVVGDGPWVLWRADRADAALALRAGAEGPADLEAAADVMAAAGSAGRSGLTAEEVFERDVLLLGFPEADLPLADEAESASQVEVEVEVESEGVGRDSEAPADPALVLLEGGADVLLRLERGRWVPVDLPGGWSGVGEARLLSLGDGGVATDRPVLLSGGGSAWTAWTWRGEGMGWASAEYGLLESDALWFVAAAGQEVAVGLGSTRAWVSVLRPSGAVRVGAMERSEEGVLPTENSERPAVVGLGDAVVLVELPGLRDAAVVSALEAEASGVVSAIGLDGTALAEGEALPIQTRSRSGPPPSQTVLMAVLMASTLVMLVFWRKDPAGQRFKLPAETAIAPLERRAAGGMIDLAVGFGLVYLWSGLGPTEVLERWPGRSEALTWGLMQPAMVAILTTVVHTAVGEALTGRSLGKAALGLRVVTQDGGEARGWRPAVRCLLKSLDLVAYLLLILMVVSPLRQRLGDLVAGTAVVVGRRENPAKFEE